MKKKAARPAKTNTKPTEFKYVPNTSYRVIESKEEATTTPTTSFPDDDDYNSGFGSYLRSPEGEVNTNFL